MKTLFLSAALLVLATLSSCKKDYTCTCTSSGTPVATYTVNATKSNATSTCNTYATTLSTSTGTTVVCAVN